MGQNEEPGELSGNFTVSRECSPCFSNGEDQTSINDGFRLKNTPHVWQWHLRELMPNYPSVLLMC